MGYGSYGYGGASGTALPIAATESRLPQRGEHRPTDTTAGLLVALERRIVDRTARGPVFARRTLPECQAHPAWRRLQAGPRDTVEYPCSAVADSHVSSAGRQVKFEVHAMDVRAAKLLEASVRPPRTHLQDVDCCYTQFRTFAK